MDLDDSIVSGARAIESLAPALATLKSETPQVADLNRTVERGYFTPEEDPHVRTWFARYLTARRRLAGLSSLGLPPQPAAS